MKLNLQGKVGTASPQIVLDTNVIVSGLLGISNSPSYLILQKIRAQQIILATSAVIIEELQEVLTRPKIAKLIKMNEEERKNYVDKLIERCNMTYGEQLAKRIGRDYRDDKFLACAYEAKADYLVTGDKDLLVLREYEGTRIISPKRFVTILSK